MTWRSLRPNLLLRADPKTAAERQLYVAVDAIMIGAVRQLDSGQQITATSALWGIAVSHHAVARLVERCPGADVRETILAAHLATLGARVDAIGDVQRLLIPAGDDAIFLGHMVNAKVHGQSAGPLVIVDTVLSCGMLREDQEKLIVARAADPAQALATLPTVMNLALA